MKGSDRLQKASSSPILSVIVTYTPVWKAGFVWDFGLVGRPGGNALLWSGGGNGDGGGGGTRWGWYAGQVQARVKDALQKNPHTRSAAFRVEVRIWPDTTGRVTRVQLVGSTGHSAVDAAIKEEVLTGLQFQEPPPADMPLPIVMRLTARRPN